VSRLLSSNRQLVFFCLRKLQRCLLRWTKPPQASLLLGMAVDLARGKSALVAENALLRQQLILLRRQVKRPVCTRTDRLLLVVLATWDIRSKKCVTDDSIRPFSAPSLQQEDGHRAAHCAASCPIFEQVSQVASTSGGQQRC